MGAYVCVCVCVCVCVFAHPQSMCIYWQAVGSESTLSVFTYENIPDWKVNRFALFMWLIIQSHIKDFLFTYFDPHNVPADKLESKGTPTQFKRHFHTAII